MEERKDIISRQAVFDALDNIKIPRNASWYPYYQQAITAVSKLPSAQPEPHWIPCSERLPEKEEQVLIYAWNVHYVLAKYREIRTCDGVYKMAWVTEDAYSAPREIKHEVICWMPLPEPYREGES